VGRPELLRSMTTFSNSFWAGVSRPKGRNSPLPIEMAFLRSHQA
jgi:hypothetical protein